MRYKLDLQQVSIVSTGKELLVTKGDEVLGQISIGPIGREWIEYALTHIERERRNDDELAKAALGMRFRQGRRGRDNNH